MEGKEVDVNVFNKSLIQVCFLSDLIRRGKTRRYRCSDVQDWFYWVSGDDHEFRGVIPYDTF